MVETLHLIGNIVLVSALIPLVLFVIYYGLFSSWRSTEIGRIMMWQKLAFIAIILTWGSTMLFGNYIGREVVRVLVYGSVTASFWFVFVQLRQTQKKFPSGKKPWGNLESIFRVKRKVRK